MEGKLHKTVCFILFLLASSQLASLRTAEGEKIVVAFLPRFFPFFLQKNAFSNFVYIYPHNFEETQRV